MWEYEYQAAGKEIIADNVPLYHSFLTYFLLSRDKLRKLNLTDIMYKEDFEELEDIVEIAFKSFNR